MKKVIALALAMLVLAACERRTEFGACIGITEDRDPGLKYKMSTRNAIIGIIFIESVIVPIFWLADEFECPIGKK